MFCDICHKEMDPDLTGYYSTELKLGGHIACMRTVMRFYWDCQAYGIYPSDTLIKAIRAAYAP